MHIFNLESTALLVSLVQPCFSGWNSPVGQLTTPVGILQEQGEARHNLPPVLCKLSCANHSLGWGISVLLLLLKGLRRH